MRKNPPTIKASSGSESRRLLSHHYTFEDVFRRYFIGRRKQISHRYLNPVRKHLKCFIEYLKSRQFKSFYRVRDNTLIEYREFLWRELANGRDGALVVRSQIHRLRCVVQLFRYLYNEGILRRDPSRDLYWEQYYKSIIQKAKMLPQKTVKKDKLTERDELRLKFLNYELGRGFDKRTVRKYKKGIEVFYEFLDSTDISELGEVNQRLLWKYYEYICNYKGGCGNPASNSYKNYILGTLKRFFRYLVRFDFLLEDPMVNWEPFKEERGLSYTCMNRNEIRKLLDAPLSCTDRLTIRDKAILETLYSTALRSKELSSLDVDDIDFEEEMVQVRSPKGGAKYYRVVPIGQMALKYLKMYLEKERPGINYHYSEALFLSYRGRRLQRGDLLDVIKKYAYQCGFRKNITTHSLRVTCATDMLKHGANIRYVQQHLGHEKLTSTQLYTRIGTDDLKKAHRKYHPREINKE